ncbi:hypothetical protein PZA11_000789 [Diplocarpon coronariae]
MDAWKAILMTARNSEEGSSKATNLQLDEIFSFATESELELSSNALYGNDTIALSYVGSGTPALDGQNVGGIASKDLFMGIFGVNPAATKFLARSNPIQSYMSSLKAQKQIPSLSYGYTAGNRYRFNTVLASLTLGGYDASLTVPNDLTFQFSADSNSELTVNIKAITISSQNNGIQGLNSASFPAIIDSTVPYLYLPIEVCRQFEVIFGLTYDYSSNLYLVNEDLHVALVEQAAQVTFTLTNAAGASDVNIAMPYAAFDLMASWPLVQNSTRYFPLKRATENSTLVLGRAFLQEAYLVADYERSNFSVYQMKWDPNAKGDIRAILPLTDTPAQAAKNRKVSITVIVAISIGGALFITIVASCVIKACQYCQRRRAMESPDLDSMSSIQPSESPRSALAFACKSELDARETQQSSPELAAVPFRATGLRIRVYPELDGHIYELPANEPVGNEVVGSPVSPVEVMLQQTIDSILDQDYGERFQEAKLRIQEEGRDVIAESRERHRDARLGAPIESWRRTD